ncbi:MAG: ORF6N domain-containing protein [Bacteroidota bacterium]
MKNEIIRADYKSLIYEIQGYKVMLDLDLANLYGVATKRLKEQVRRNIDRFPEDFMFILTNEEFKNLRSQFATSSWGGSRYKHMVFTEQGVAMLSSVLNSEKAVKVNIGIMRAFVSYRALLLENNEIKNEIRSLDEKINKIFDFLLEKIDALHQNESDLPLKKFIGYKNYDQDSSG